ncbi:polymorphic toxin-type HINT domain-containing protein [Promicromonospora umidemergens]|uniref:polymorphic toxin-type HINT domain-containing protein n=1 Tax=Promicromonospora umidemergens TaxID=629679 RepID=UPI0020A3309C|nr:polymorphic toxin-type HINT domain-containing protein [Promicromonospora umidemergens]
MGLDADPTPGDPVLVLSGGQEYLEVAESIDSAASSMSRLDVDGTISQAVDSLMSAKEDTIGEIRKAHSRYVAAGDALVGYASSLERVQGETLAALDRAREAQDAAQAASGSKDRWQDLADGAKDESEKQEYEQKAQQAGGDADQAAGVISSARSSVESAVSDRDRAAEHAVDRIEEITSSDDLNDGWWDNWGSKLVAAIADIADMISTIAGILAIIVAFIPIVGTALAGVLIVIAAVAAIVSAVANITLAATGERSWAEAGLAIAGAALSLIGLGAAAKAIKGLKGVKCFFGTCFVAGTLVRTSDGEKPIEDIRVGDKVWARNLDTVVDELHLVEETFVRSTAELFHLTIGGTVVTTTAEHPFMVAGQGWTDAAFLKEGDTLVTSEGTVTLDGIDVEAREETVYNFHVEMHRNYYVYAGGTAVLVHNAGHTGAAAKRSYKVVTERAVGSYRKFTPGKPGDKLTPNHMPQNALLQKGLKDRAGKLVDISMGDGITVVMKHADHKLTRTFCGRGGTPGTNAGDNFQDVLELDIKDLQKIGNTQYGDPTYYDGAARELIDQWDTFTDTNGKVLNLVDGAALKTKLGL